MYDKLVKEIQKKAYFAKHKKVLIAVSGGVDSMNLLHFLYIYRKKLDIEIGIAHVNHKQRVESDTEENYLRDWANEHQIPIYVSYFSGNFSEKTARDFRYHFFKQIMNEQNYTALVTAHHADDQAETIFMRILRGSRLRHLSGIQAVSPFANGELIRPFLAYFKKDLPDIFHFEDDSNQSLEFLRNRIRNRYIPILEEENPKFKQGLRQLGEESEQLFQAFQDLTQNIDVTNCSQFLAQSQAVQTILLQNYLENYPDLQVTRGQFEEILQTLRNKSNAKYHIKSNYWLVKDYDAFQIKKISPKTDRELDQKMIDYSSIVNYGQYRFQFVSKDKEGIALYSLSPVLLRRRQEGDRIDFGKFSKKLRRLFIDEKIPSQERADAIIGEQDGKIIFVLVADKTYLRKPSKHDIMEGKLYIEKIRNR
ncbi:tRNA lysidine(34) synthetase TilS [Streptococcus equinus]|uniref:tRNA lysidine(34) synthetase TilS n=1 Tax=Streptococcus equinus TaxID=1335 RepID=UPI00088E4856|nr:tRNA lysidine(34) synthetase TilS [Streptococcus equinus]SDI98941.1 tRNA(Ile)-lysidine synthase [Streptococcus equinus]SEP94498.1 tRNA(Ile)-lysidine synthase [Streptococcus equinus]